MKLNRTVLRSINILTYISSHSEGVSLEELCKAFSIPKTSAYDILVTLVHSGMLTVCEKTGTQQLYQIGINAYRIGLSYPNANDELKLIASELKNLARQTGRTAFFGKLSGHEVVYVLKEVPENPIITTATLGSTAPLYCTSLGKVLLAYLPKAEIDSLIDDLTLTSRTDHTICDKQVLINEIMTVRARGYALDLREYEEHMACASAPVFRQDGSLVGAVSISGFYQAEENYELAGEHIKNKATEISALLGSQCAKTQ
ncbi:MAG: IclR family transcriptional regulator [Clostridiales bacterium]|nr:IclR family transcriptional regulator [Clostridiales bacterium]